MTGRADLSRERNGGGPQPHPTSTICSPASGLARSIKISETGASKVILDLLPFGPVLAAGPFQYAIWSALDRGLPVYPSRANRGVGFGALRRAAFAVPLARTSLRTCPRGQSALIRNVTKRSLVSPFRFPFALDLLRRLFLVNIAVLGNGLSLGVAGPAKKRLWLQRRKTLMRIPSDDW